MFAVVTFANRCSSVSVCLPACTCLIDQLCQNQAIVSTATLCPNWHMIHLCSEFDLLMCENCLRFLLVQMSYSDLLFSTVLPFEEKAWGAFREATWGPLRSAEEEGGHWRLGAKSGQQYGKKNWWTPRDFAKKRWGHEADGRAVQEIHGEGENGDQNSGSEKAASGAWRPGSEEPALRARQEDPAPRAWLREEQSQIRPGGEANHLRLVQHGNGVAQSGGWRPAHLAQSEHVVPGPTAAVHQRQERPNPPSAQINLLKTLEELQKRNLKSCDLTWMPSDSAFCIDAPHGLLKCCYCPLLANEHFSLWSQKSCGVCYLLR